MKDPGCPSVISLELFLKIKIINVLQNKDIVRQVGFY
jgi:hypothetical protein